MRLKSKSAATTALMIFSVVGVFATGYSVFKFTPKYLEKVEENPNMGYSERFKLVFKVFWPSFVIGGSTAACIICGDRMHLRRETAFAAGLAMTETAFRDYRSKVVETVGEKVDKEIKDSIAEDKMKEDPPKNLPLTENFVGEMLFYDVISARYFFSTVEKVRQAENAINQSLVLDMYASVNEFYDFLDLEHISVGDDLGWNVDNLLHVDLTTAKVRPEDNRACIIMNYYIEPRYDYRKLL